MVFTTLSAVLGVSLAIVTLTLVFRLVCALVKPVLLISLGVFLGAVFLSPSEQSPQHGVPLVKLGADNEEQILRTNVDYPEAARAIWAQSAPLRAASLDYAERLALELVDWVRANAEDFAVEKTTQIALWDDVTKRVREDGHRRF